MARRGQAMTAKGTTTRKALKRRARIVEFIAAYHAKHGCSPSWMEIAEAVGFTRASSVAYHIAALVADGQLARGPGPHRTLVVPARKEQQHDAESSTTNDPTGVV